MKDFRFANFPAVRMLILTAFLLPSVVHARPTLPEATPFGYGTSWNIATAYSGAALDSGLVGGVMNPAAYVSSKNELLGEGQVYSNLSAQVGVTAPSLRWGAGSIGYLNRYKQITMALVYIPLESLESGYTYGTSQVVQRSQQSEISIATAIPLSERSSVGVQIGNIRGTSNDGVLQSEADGDTSLAPHLVEFRLGARYTGQRWSVALAVQAPPFGSISIDRPVNVTNRRESRDFSYRGSGSATLGIGYRTGQMMYAVDATVRNPGFSRIGDAAVSSDGIQADLSGSLRWQTTDMLQLTAGLSMRLVDPDSRKHLIFGIGGSYEPTPEITLIGGAGLMFGMGDGVKGIPLENVRPWVLRGGAIFHGE